MEHDEDAQVLGVSDVGEERENRVGSAGIEACDRLIREDHPRSLAERASNGDPLGLPAGQGVRTLTCEIGKTDAIERVERPAAKLSRKEPSREGAVQWQLAERAKRNILQRSPPAHEQNLLKNHRSRPASLPQLLAATGQKVRPAQADRALIGLDQTHCTPQQRRLTAAVRSENDRELTRPDSDVDAVQNLVLPVGLLQARDLKNRPGRGSAEVRTPGLCCRGGGQPMSVIFRCSAVTRLRIAV
jgi:hypothetical protein